MTLIDTEVGFNVQVIEGKGRLKSSRNAARNAAGLPGLPHLCSFEIVSARFEDPNSTEFLRPGLSMRSAGTSNPLV
jgi:hypothetical protein